MGIFLVEDLGEANSVFNTRCLGCSVKRKLCRAYASRYGQKLVKVAYNDELNAAKWYTTVVDCLRNQL